MSIDGYIINFDDPGQRRLFNGWVRTLKGNHRVSIVKPRSMATDEQRGYYFGVVVPDVQAGIEEAWGEKWNLYQTHCYLRDKFVRIDVVDKHTGEVKDDRAGSTTELDVLGYSDLIEKSIQFAREWLNTTVREADKFHESNTTPGVCPAAPPPGKPMTLQPTAGFGAWRV